MRRAALAILGIAVSILILEALARIAFQFPIYEADSDVGFWPAPEQEGTFLFTNDWAFNEHSLGVSEAYRPSDKLDVLLVGDSIVFGGSKFRQSEKLGPVLEEATGWQVWPASAQGWALQNELSFLRRDKALAEGADVIVFVLNDGDFSGVSEWQSPYTHPLVRPTFMLPFLVRRFLFNSDEVRIPYPVLPEDVLQDWQTFARESNREIFVLAYSSKATAGQVCNWVPADFRKVGTWACYDGMEEVGPEAFLDEVHPTSAAIRIIAHRIAEMVKSGRPLQ